VQLGVQLTSNSSAAIPVSTPRESLNTWEAVKQSHVPVNIEEISATASLLLGNLTVFGALVALGSLVDFCALVVLGCFVDFRALVALGCFVNVRALVALGACDAFEALP